jgi:uncharacterized protein YndB with AHSA1/START domain
MRAPMTESVNPSATFDHTLLIAATPGRVMAAFFDPGALAAWWQTARSVTTPRAPGVYAVEWEPTPDADEILGRLGGVFHGTVMDYIPGRELLVADAWWLPPDGDPIGPMSLEVSCQLEGAGCRLRVRQSGFEESTRWRRYYDVIAHGWTTSLASLKRYLEARSGG